jgi:hypothetical protein
MVRRGSSDTVIYAVGQKRFRDEADASRFCAPEFHQIGDCLTRENIAAPPGRVSNRQGHRRVDKVRLEM